MFPPGQCTPPPDGAGLEQVRTRDWVKPFEPELQAFAHATQAVHPPLTTYVAIQIYVLSITSGIINYKNITQRFIVMNIICWLYQVIYYTIIFANSPIGAAIVDVVGDEYMK